jgi:hypothetical protein
MTRLVPRVVSSRPHDLALRTQVRPYAGEAVTELVPRQVGSYAQAIEASRRSHVSAVGIFRPNHWRKSSLLARIRLNCAEKTAHSAGYLMKRGREFKSRLDRQAVSDFGHSPADLPLPNVTKAKLSLACRPAHGAVCQTLMVSSLLEFSAATGPAVTTGTPLNWRENYWRWVVVACTAAAPNIEAPWLSVISVHDQYLIKSVLRLSARL